VEGDRTTTDIKNLTRMTSIPKPHPPYRGRRNARHAHFKACLRRGRLVGFVHDCVHAETIHAHRSRANILETNVAARAGLLRV
jgi:hypothetical protein